MTLKQKEIDFRRLKQDLESNKEESLQKSSSFLIQIQNLKLENTQLRNKINFLEDCLLEKEEAINQQQLNLKSFYIANIHRKE